MSVPSSPPLRTLLPAWALWALTWLAWGPPGAEAGSLQALETRHFVVRFPQTSRVQAEAVSEEADPLAERLQGELGVALDGRAEIIVCGSRREFDAAVGKAQPAWVVGVAQPEANRIVLAQGSVKGMRRVARHEVVHLLVGRALGAADAAAPRWLQEGAAKYYGDDWTAADRAALADAADSGRLHTIDELADFPTHPDESAVAYAESYVLVEYLVSLDPQHGLAPFLAELRRTADVRRALMRTYRLSQEQVEAGWLEAVAAKTRREPVSWAVETTFFLLLAIVFLFAYVRVRRRSREIRRRMEEEELVERLFEETRRREERAPDTPYPRWADDEEDDTP